MLTKRSAEFFKKKYGVTIWFDDDGEYMFVKLRNNRLALPVSYKTFTDTFKELTEFCEECDRKHARQSEEFRQFLLKTYPNSRWVKVLKEVA